MTSFPLAINWSIMVPRVQKSPNYLKIASGPKDPSGSSCWSETLYVIGLNCTKSSLQTDLRSIRCSFQRKEKL